MKDKTVYFSGYGTTSSGADINGVTLTFSNNGGTATTDANGLYHKYVSCGWSGTVTPSGNVGDGDGGNGEITLFTFVDGLQPYKEIFSP